MKEPIIKSIVEAFSMHPEILQITEDKNTFWKHNEACKEIKLEYLEGVYNKEFVEYYVGYNFDGKKLFQYLAKSVNVHYKIE